ncbi:hypothetical protein KFK09_013628 [Dendrobium nobile]|uniref:Uncharacterized protein n=1 Tax=Dendrobium nobile TaxID=94219 RepID=A0A8T3B7W3_DENNO|nr:hypothetical protein KFK09_013628 [Dendrobium nobile]
MASIPCSIHLHESSSFDEIDVSSFIRSMGRIASSLCAIRRRLGRNRAKVGPETPQKPPEEIRRADVCYN